MPLVLPILRFFSDVEKNLAEEGGYNCNHELVNIELDDSKHDTMIILYNSDVLVNKVTV